MPPPYCPRSGFWSPRRCPTPRPILSSRRPLACTIPSWLWMCSWSRCVGAAGVMGGACAPRGVKGGILRHFSLSIRASHLVQFSCRFPRLTCPPPLLSPCRPPPTPCSDTSSHSFALSGCSTSSARGEGCASRCECVRGGRHGSCAGLACSEPLF